VKKKNTAPLSGAALVKTITAAAEDKLAEKITAIDLREAPSVADYFIVCEGETDVQNRAIADGIIDRCSERNTIPWHYEGESEGRWVVIDFSDVVVHIMLPDVRKHYNLEDLWRAARKSAQIE